LASGQFRHADYAWLHLGSRYFAPLALLHYLLIGEARGFRPTPFFDPDFYGRHGGKGRGNAFAAFLRQPDGAPACAEYEEAWYAAQNPDVATNGLSVWAHCQKHAIADLRDPSPSLSMEFVITAYNARPQRRARALIKLFEQRRGPHRGALPLLASELKEAQNRVHAGIMLKTLSDGPKRRDTLVYVQTNGRHPQHLHESTRRYDLLLNYYAPPEEQPPTAEYVFQQGGTKVTGIYKLLQARPEVLTQYDFVLFLDDDILLSAPDINRLFEIMRDEKLDFAQPSLTPESYGSFPALFHKADSPGPRRVNYVEIMAPALSRRALVAAKDCFGAGISGFAVDSLIGKTVRENFGDTVAVIDAVAARHTREIDLGGGALYRFLSAKGIDPLVEMHVLEAEAGLEHGLREI
jgi:hypothetical protein